MLGVYSLIKVNQSVEISLTDDKNPYRSRVEAINVDRLVLASPLKNGSIVPLYPGTVVRVTYTDQGAVYTFSSEVIAQTTGTPPMVTLGPAYDITRIQRRNFVRIEVRLAVELQRLDEEGNLTGEIISGYTTDTSGGGMRLNTNAQLADGEIMGSTLFLDKNVTVRARGRVMRVIENIPKLKEKYSVGFEYTMIEEPERDKIIKFIFNKQLELRKKGLL